MKSHIVELTSKLCKIWDSNKEICNLVNGHQFLELKNSFDKTLNSAIGIRKSLILQVCGICKSVKKAKSPVYQAGFVRHLENFEFQNFLFQG